MTLISVPLAALNMSFASYLLMWIFSQNYKSIAQSCISISQSSQALSCFEPICETSGADTFEKQRCKIIYDGFQSDKARRRWEWVPNINKVCADLVNKLKSPRSFFRGNIQILFSLPSSIYSSFFNFRALTISSSIFHLFHVVIGWLAPTCRQFL